VKPIYSELDLCARASPVGAQSARSASVEVAPTMHFSPKPAVADAWVGSVASVIVCVSTRYKENYTSATNTKFGTRVWQSLGMR